MDQQNKEEIAQREYGKSYDQVGDVSEFAGPSPIVSKLCNNSTFPRDHLHLFT
jgi:hypothetical protein